MSSVYFSKLLNWVAFGDIGPEPGDRVFIVERQAYRIEPKGMRGPFENTLYFPWKRSGTHGTGTASANELVTARILFPDDAEPERSARMMDLIARKAATEIGTYQADSHTLMTREGFRRVYCVPQFVAAHLVGPALEGDTLFQISRGELVREPIHGKMVEVNAPSFSYNGKMFSFPSIVPGSIIESSGALVEVGRYEDRAVHLTADAERWYAVQAIAKSEGFGDTDTVELLYGFREAFAAPAKPTARTACKRTSAEAAE